MQHWHATVIKSNAKQDLDLSKLSDQSAASSFNVKKMRRIQF